MKTTVKYMMALLFAVSVTFFSSCEQKGGQLPDKATAFLNEHFPGEEILEIEKEAGKYEVKIQNGKEVAFDRAGVWIKVDCKDEAVPVAVIPAAIVNYLDSNYAGLFVKEIEVFTGKYEVDLSNGYDLLFNMNGDFLRREK